MTGVGLYVISNPVLAREMELPWLAKTYQDSLLIEDESPLIESFEKGVDTGANTDDLLAKVVTSNLEVTLQYWKGTFCVP